MTCYIVLEAEFKVPPLESGPSIGGGGGPGQSGALLAEQEYQSLRTVGYFDSGYHANAAIHSPSHLTGSFTVPSEWIITRNLQVTSANRIYPVACPGRYFVECAAAGIASPAGVAASSALASETKSLK